MRLILWFHWVSSKKKFSKEISWQTYLLLTIPSLKKENWLAGGWSVLGILG
jgi:hypothetical protein